MADRDELKPNERDIVEMCEHAGLWPNTVHQWISKFEKYNAELLLRFGAAPVQPVAQMNSDVTQIIAEMREEARERRVSDDTAGIFADEEGAAQLEDWADRLVSHPFNAVQDARQLWRNRMPCDHVFMAMPIDGSNRADVPCKAVCAHCGFEPDGTVPQVAQSVPTNEQLRKVLHKYSSYLGHDHHSDTEFSSLQDVMAFAREVLTLAAPVAASPSIVPSDERNLAQQIIWLATAGNADKFDMPYQINEGDWGRLIKKARTLLTTASNAGEAAQGDKP